MAQLKVQVILPYFSNQPQDVSSNTWYWQTLSSDPASPAELQEIADRLQAFYAAFDERLAACISRTNGALLRFYDMNEPTPRQPLDAPASFPLAAASNATNLPGELALVFSYHAAFASGIPNARRRGRLYLGPFISTQSNPGSATAFARPEASLITAVANAAILLFTLVTEPVVWSQYSPTNDEWLPVSEGWVDNEWDIQRRRGVEASARTLWSGP